MIKWRNVSPLDLYKLVLGAFLFLSPWLYGFVHTPASLDAWMGGSILMVASAAALLVFNDWEEWLALFLGLWMIAAPWVLSFPHTATKIHLIAGFICAFLAGLELWLVHYDQRGSMNDQHTRR